MARRRRSRHGSTRSTIVWAKSRPRPRRPNEPEWLYERWAVTGSNRRPPACKAGALPAELTARGTAQSTSAAGVDSADVGREGDGSKQNRKRSSWPRSGRISFGGCPQRDSNPRYHLERVAT